MEELSPKPKLSNPRPRSRVAESVVVLNSPSYKRKLAEEESMVKSIVKPKGKS